MGMDQRLLEKICEKYHLGRLVSAPFPLSGGFLHKMYGVCTDQGKYAVKLLNPHIMRRVGVMEKYRAAEELETHLEKEGIPVLPALVMGNKKMQELEGRFFYIFVWYGGKALCAEEVSERHCKEMGKAAARIHGIDIRKKPYRREELHINWRPYLERIKGEDRELYLLFKDSISLLYQSQERGNAAFRRLPGIVSICHNDMDRKNVLWKGGDYRIIDLECLAYASPFLEMYETALCWSGYQEGAIDFNLFQAFLKAYFDAGGPAPDEWEVLYDSNCGRLEWLEYNLKRALGMESDVSERETGISEAAAALRQAVYYDRAKKEILDAAKNSMPVK